MKHLAHKELSKGYEGEMESRPHNRLGYHFQKDKARLQPNFHKLFVTTVLYQVSQTEKTSRLECK